VRRRVAVLTACDLLVGGLLVPLVGAMFLPQVQKNAALNSIALGGALVVMRS